MVRVGVGPFAFVDEWEWGLEHSPTREIDEIESVMEL